MQKLYFLSSIFFIFFMASCGKSDNDCTDVAYDKAFKAKLNQEFCLPDGTSFVVLDVVCVWPGTIFVKTEVTLASGKVLSYTFVEDQYKGLSDKSDDFEATLLTAVTDKEEGCVPYDAEDFELDILVKEL
jgi:hypothetical protein